LWLMSPTESKVKAIPVDLDRPWGIQGVEAPRFQDTWHIKVVSLPSPTHRPPSPPRKHSWHSFLLDAESTPRVIVLPEWLCQWKTPITPSGIEPANFGLVEQCLYQLRHPTSPTKPT
jgi:hypothetical protein